jgi:hypothetical protein
MIAPSPAIVPAGNYTHRRRIIEMKSKLVRMLLTGGALFAFSGIMAVNALADGAGPTPLPPTTPSITAPAN